MSDDPLEGVLRRDKDVVERLERAMDQFTGMACHDFKNSFVYQQPVSIPTNKHHPAGLWAYILENLSLGDIDIPQLMLEAALQFKLEPDGLSLQELDGMQDVTPVAKNADINSLIYDHLGTVKEITRLDKLHDKTKLPDSCKVDTEGDMIEKGIYHDFLASCIREPNYACFCALLCFMAMSKSSDALGAALLRAPASYKCYKSSGADVVCHPLKLSSDHGKHIALKMSCTRASLRGLFYYSLPIYQQKVEGWYNAMMSTHLKHLAHNGQILISLLLQTASAFNIEVGELLDMLGSTRGARRDVRRAKEFWNKYADADDRNLYPFAAYYIHSPFPPLSANNSYNTIYLLQCLLSPPGSAGPNAGVWNIKSKNTPSAEIREELRKYAAYLSSEVLGEQKSGEAATGSGEQKGRIQKSKKIGGRQSSG